MDLFGFEDEETIDNIQTIVPEKKIPATERVQAEPKDQMSITQIQELLLSELNATETTLDSTLGESSIYDKDPESVTPELTRPRRAARLKNIPQNESSIADETTSEFKNKVTRAYPKPVRQKKPMILGEIQNTYFSDDTVNTSVIKRKRDVVKKKTKAQNNADIENEHVEHIAEEINNKFKQIEEFQLLVE